MGQKHFLFIFLILALLLGSTAWAGELVAQTPGNPFRVGATLEQSC